MAVDELGWYPLVNKPVAYLLLHILGKVYLTGLCTHRPTSQAGISYPYVTFQPLSFFIILAPCTSCQKHASYVLMLS